MAPLKDSTVTEKLNTNNNSNWSFKIEMTLIKFFCYDLFEVITKNPPDAVINDWQKKDEKA